MASNDLRLILQDQTFVERAGYRVWETERTPCAWPAAKTALVLCDVWNRHTCRGAEERLEKLLPRMAEVVKTLREKGVLIVHAPSDTMAFYEGHPARQRVLDVPAVATPADLQHDEPPLPVDPTDACDTCPDEMHPKHERGMPYPWTRQHAAIDVDETRDVVSCSGQELWSYYQHRGIEHVLEMGVHTNMCILNRTFSIKQMVRWGMDIALIRDMTDCMYNPSKPPYVAHEEATQLIVGYIEKFWCPTVTSDEVLAGVR
jgi:nicotinamidase-related amidase